MKCSLLFTEVKRQALSSTRSAFSHLLDLHPAHSFQAPMSSLICSSSQFLTSLSTGSFLHLQSLLRPPLESKKCPPFLTQLLLHLHLPPIPAFSSLLNFSGQPMSITSTFYHQCLPLSDSPSAFPKRVSPKTIPDCGVTNCWPFLYASSSLTKPETSFHLVLSRSVMSNSL